MTTRNLPFGKPWIGDEEKQAVLEVLSGDVLTHGPQSKAFEEEFAKYMGGGYCVSVSSGMAALHLSYLEMGIGAGDEVIVPAETHVATAHAVEMVGAKPVFLDCEPGTGNIDASKLESLITKKTKAISMVHFLGVPCDMDAIMKVADKHGLKVIEDCALAIGSRYKGTHVGLIGDTGCYSFYPVKHITTGDGGMFVTKHKEVAARVSKIRGFYVDKTFSERSIPGMYDTLGLGLNYRMSDINASIGRQQLKRMGVIRERREANFNALKSGLSKISGISILDSQSKDALSSFYCLSLVLEKPLDAKRIEIVKKLNAAGVGTSVYYPQPVPRMSYYQNKYGYNAADFAQAERISDQSIALPVGVHLTTDDMRYIAETFSSVLKELH
ncbi:MAG: DegT/DnrJ/EryC1/StrS family aminotransferase [Anaerolineales bacterium]|nr:MAG: DegT/DnrJ/EryC1/StrS family aminotransferase [Anaerolineales bacterium]